MTNSASACSLQTKVLKLVSFDLPRCKHFPLSQKGIQKLLDGALNDVRCQFSSVNQYQDKMTIFVVLCNVHFKLRSLGMHAT